MIIEKWKQSSAYVVGRSHLSLNEECQDRTYYLSGQGIHVLSLADGAGSKAKSQIGAEIVTKEICELLINNFDKFIVMLEKRGKDEKKYLEDIKALKKIILDYLIEKLKAYPFASVNELSSTLLFFALKNNKYIQGHIGDGVIGGLFEENDSFYLQTLSEPHNAEAANVTFFVTDSNASENLRITCGEANNLRGIILMSDGPAEVMYHDEYGLVDDVVKVFTNYDQIEPTRYSKILSEFLKERIAEFSSDDLSINLLYLESIPVQDLHDTYIANLLTDIKSKDNIIFKSQYCIHLDTTIKPNKIHFHTLQDVLGYLKWS